jgi:hypothetical protein
MENYFLELAKQKLEKDRLSTENDMLKATIIDYKMNLLQLEIKYSMLYRKMIDIGVSYNKYVAENPKDEYNTDDEYDSDDESDDDMIPFKNDMKPHDWYPKNEDEEEVLEVFDLY